MDKPFKNRRKSKRNYSQSDLEDRLSRFPTNRRWWIYLGEAYMREGSFIKARNCFETSLYLSQNYPTLNNKTIRCLTKNGNGSEKEDMMQLRNVCWSSYRSSNETTKHQPR